ncbi:hypothetical protein TNCV_1588991 [Trichonephila clavipes]|uniref:Uncharacterized protein n=1 Tax=Trichonephila clavipes TaxID=2585209 RepID=A0A8X6V3H3_TRICX|nr:hypothetical protein TNCV_1588991 [Trichonephila clavipes]
MRCVNSSANDHVQLVNESTCRGTHSLIRRTTPLCSGDRSSPSGRERKLVIGVVSVESKTQVLTPLRTRCVEGEICRGSKFSR